MPHDPLRGAFDADKSAKRYDEVPYYSYPIALLDPSRLGAVAALWGHRPPAPETARILEIGCATGGHIIGLAARYPQATVNGLDVSEVQIETGRARISRLGLSNITLATQSVTELGAAEGPFDYIICHGVFSWVSDEVRNAILKSCKALLAENGMAAISFNVLPGWRLLQVIRDTAILHAGRFEKPAEKAAEMRALFEALSKMTQESSSYGSVWRKELSRMTPMPDFYLLHELLEDHNTPMTFTAFNAALDAHALHYLADANFQAGIPENAGPEKGALIRNLADGQRIMREQYADILTGRTFRTAIVVGSPPVECEADAHLHFLEGMQIVSPASTILRSDEKGAAILRYFNDGELLIESPNVAQAIKAMLERRPSTTSLNEMLKPQASEEERYAVLEGLKMLVCMGIVDASLVPTVCQNKPADNPLAWPLARSDAEAAEEFTCSMLQTPVKLTDRSRFLLKLADGNKSLAEISERLLAVVTGGGAAIAENGTPITDVNRLRQIISKTVFEEFESFATSGLLIR
jgi:2-polyprenyl-3-methyl-5-hydroxy-6-metoxy-1,4-benzoquinol methylase/methyltransferase-like protein